MEILSFNEFVNESKTLGKSFYKKMKDLNDQIESLKNERKERVKPFNIEKDAVKKEEIKKDLVKLTKEINDLESQLQKMRAEELSFIENLDAGAELQVSESFVKFKNKTEE